MTEKTEFYKDYAGLLQSIDTIAKTKEGYGYTYLELTPLLDIVMPKLIEHNFVLVQYVKQSEGVYKRRTVDDAGDETTIETPAFVLHSDLIHTSGVKIECDMPLYVDDIDPQAMGSAETYMRRYSIYCLLNIKVKDNDGLEASAKAKRKKDSEGRKSFDELETVDEFKEALLNCKTTKESGALFYRWSVKFPKDSEEYKTLSRMSADIKLKLENPNLNVEVRK